MKRDLEEAIEALRRKMEMTALDLGIGHPSVYQLSLELDQLHNEWMKKSTNVVENVYLIRPQTSTIREMPIRTVV